MNAKQFEKLLIELSACSDGMAFAKGKSLAVVWKTLKRADWACWLLVKMADKPGWPSKSVVHHALCDCAETALKYTTDKMPAETIRIARLYADGKATDEELAAAKAAVWASVGAAAKAAAWAAAWASAGYTAGYTAWAAAWAAAEAAAWASAWAAAVDAARDAARDIAHLQMCALVRKRVGKFEALGVK